MNDAIKIMLSKYDLKSVDDYENALKEIIQEIALLGLWRSKFFEHAAFYGGSALRILYGLDRFSEDMDFSLLKSNLNFSIASYIKAISDELESFAFSVSVQRKEKKVKTNIESAFIKAGTIQNMIIIETPSNLSKKININKNLKIKIEVDIDPPQGFETEAKYLLNPIPFSLNTYSLPDLFAGKMHALLCRNWTNRVKGRDWYDFIWYLQKGIQVNKNQLRERMIQSGHLNEKDNFTEKILKKMLFEKIDNIDYDLAKKDVMPFLKDQTYLDLWSRNFFHSIVENYSF